MPISQALLPEFDNEMKGVRRTLERVPEEKFAWKPHAKSWHMGGLATHLANIPTWANLALEKDSLDLAPGGAPLPQTKEHPSRAALLEAFDKNVAAARAAIASASDEHLVKPWTLLRNGQQLLALPRAVVLRNFVLNHTIHHRAQLGVYLRLNDVPVPAIYGPSADEMPF
jgi:uncharacterized damage-inducible protein DinB